MSFTSFTNFKNAPAYIELITLLASDKAGMSRSEIEVKAKLSTNGGRLTERLRDLCVAGFIDKEYVKNLQKKIAIFKSKTKTDKKIFLAFVSSKGIKKNLYAEELVSSVVTLDDLFKQAD